jgi:hypothetical protein
MWANFVGLASAFESFGQFTRTLKHALPELVSFGHSLIVAFFSFATAGHILFGATKEGVWLVEQFHLSVANCLPLHPPLDLL